MKLLDFIVCDDIREEVGSKLTLVGIYNDRIVFNDSKLTSEQGRDFLMSVYAKIIIEKKDEETDFKVIIKDKNSDKVYNEQVFKIRDDHPYGLPFPYIGKMLAVKLFQGESIQIIFQKLKSDKLLEEVVSQCCYDVIFT